MQSVLLGNIKEPSYAMKESLRVLKTNLQFCGDDKNVILVTSALPGEGKSTVSVELARSLTESGNNVLLIDTDIRKSVLVGRLMAKATDKSELLGLSHFLSGQKKLEDVLYATNIKQLYMIFAGPTVPNPTELLDKKYFLALIEGAKKQFDYVIVDCAPVAVAIDAAVVAKYCDGAIFVVAQDMANRRLVLNAKKQLQMSGVPILGVVLSKMKQSKGRYGYGRYYGSYYGGHEHSNEQSNMHEAE